MRTKYCENYIFSLILQHYSSVVIIKKHDYYVKHHAELTLTSKCQTLVMVPDSFKWRKLTKQCGDLDLGQYRTHPRLSQKNMLCYISIS